jgi:hypothetical protein
MGSSGPWTTSAPSPAPARLGTRTAIALSIILGLLAALAIVYAIRHAPRAEERERQPLRLRIRRVLTGRLGRLMVGVSAFEFGNVAATLLILRPPSCWPLAVARTGPPSSPSASMSPTTSPPRWPASPPAGLGTAAAPSWSSASGCSGWLMQASPSAGGR